MSENRVNQQPDTYFFFKVFTKSDELFLNRINHYQHYKIIIYL